VKVLRRWHRHLLNKRQAKGVQICLAQRSIFVLPSRFALSFMLALLLILLVGINYRHNLAYGLCFVLLALFFIALLHSFANLSGLCIQAESSPAVFAGEQAGFRVRLYSNKRAHQSISIGFHAKALQVHDLPAGGSITLTLDCPASQRGWLEAAPLLIESHFPLGLWRVWSWVCLKQRVLVYPRPLATDTVLSSHYQDALDGRHSVAVGVDDFQGLRRFAPGDSLKRLDWKAWSRERGLLVKEFSETSGSTLWLDFSALPGDSETRLSILTQQVLTLCASGQRFGLRLPEQSIPSATVACRLWRCTE